MSLLLSPPPTLSRLPWFSLVKVVTSILFIFHVFSLHFWLHPQQQQSFYPRNIALLFRWHMASFLALGRSMPAGISGPPSSSWGPSCSTLLYLPSTHCWDLQSEHSLVCYQPHTCFFSCRCFKELGVFQPVNSSSLSLEFPIHSDPHLFFNLYVHAEGTISARGYILKCTYYSWEGVRSGRKTDAAASVRLQQKGDVSFCQLVRSTRLVDVLPPKHYLQHVLLIQMFEMTSFSLNILAPAVSKSGGLDVHN